MSEISLVWFRNDLRTTDHEPLLEAAKAGPVVCLYLYEEDTLAEESDGRRLSFLNDGLTDLGHQLAQLGGHLLVRQGEAEAVLEALRQETAFEHLWFHRFPGDAWVLQWCESHKVVEHGIFENGFPAATKRAFMSCWKTTMSHPVLSEPERLHSPAVEDRGRLLASATERSWIRGGRQRGWQVQNRFLTRDALKGTNDESSRFLPYLQWGCLSMREVFHATLERSHWLLEAQETGESIDQGWFQGLKAHIQWVQQYARCLDSIAREEASASPGKHQCISWKQGLAAWKKGMTGHPIIDAHLRCLQATGWLPEERLHGLFGLAVREFGIASQEAFEHLSSLTIGNHPAYLQRGCLEAENKPTSWNPRLWQKQWDAEGRFVKTWVSEVEDLPTDALHDPSCLSEMEQLLFGCVLGSDYPFPLAKHPATRSANAGELVT